MNIEQIISTIYNLQQLKCHGVAESEITETEKKLNVVFPEILRNYYLKFGNTKTLNYNDALFKPQDTFIDYLPDEQYLVICKKEAGGEFYGIKITDLHRKNPLVYTKSYMRIHSENNHRVSLVWHKSHKNCETLEKFLMHFIIENSFDGGLKYGFSVYDTNDIEHTAMLIKNETIALQKVNEISDSNDNSSVYSNYFIDNHCAMHILYISEKNGNKMGFLQFAAGDKTVYKKIKNILNDNGIKTEKNENPANNYKIYKRLSATIGSIIVPGTYDDWRTRRKEAILVPEESVNKIDDLLLQVNPDFDYYGISTEYSKEQIKDLVVLLANRVEEMKRNESFMFHPKNKRMEYNDFYYRDNIDYRRYKKYILKMIQELVNWLNTVKEEKINIIGV
jgi:hypothetical protein